MAQNKTEDLKNHLFQILEELNNPEDGQDMSKTIEKGKALAAIAGRINETIKLELQAIELADSLGYNVGENKDSIKNLLTT